MVKQPLKEYLETHVQYKLVNLQTPCRRWQKSKFYNNTEELIKRDFQGHKFYIIPRMLFRRYMNIFIWEWE